MGQRQPHQMNPDEPDISPLEDFQEVEVKPQRRFSIVWLIPLVAVLIGGWLAYHTLSEMGPTIIITFKDGGSLEAGKTKIKYKAVEVGEVETVALSEDLTHVTVTAKMHKDTEPHLTDETQFWVVRPQVGVGGISGLETLVSGAYIAMDPRPGHPTKTFTGLEEPPGVTAQEKGTQFRLRAESLGTINWGTSVFFRDIPVGRVVGYKLTEDNRNVLIDIFIESPHDREVQANSRFWKMSGVEVSMGAEGFDLKVGSLAAMIGGGIAFITPVTATGTGEPSPPESVFPLYESYTRQAEARFTEKVPYLMRFDGSVRGLQVGAPVEFRGIKMGEVVDIGIEFDPKTATISVPVVAHIEPERMPAPQLQKAGANPYDRAAVMVEKGLRARLETGSLLTGQLFIGLEFYPDLPKATLIRTGKYPEVPTLPSTMTEVQKTINSVLADLRKMPLDQLVAELVGTAKGANRLMNSKELRQAVGRFDAALKDLQHLTRNLDSLAGETEKTVKAARSALDPQSPAAVNLSDALKELSAAARSIRALTDYLERHPESLVRGKSGS